MDARQRTDQSGGGGGGPLHGHPKFVKVKSLGHGSFGSVDLARNKVTGELVAVKTMKRCEMTKYVEGEIFNHSMLRHPHVIQFKEVALNGDYLCIAMEYATGGCLFDYVRSQVRLKEAVARWFMQQLLIGVDYCHRMGVVNRDIKLENTLLQKVQGLPLPLVKICDFGYSKADFKSVPKSKVGTLAYMAPEVLLNRESQYDGKAADIWSCGVMLYVMLAGAYPFEGPAGGGAKPTDIMRMLDKMVNQQYALPRGIAVSAGCQDLLGGMMMPEPGKRITMDRILAHPWFLANLPSEASSMNDTYLHIGPVPGAQSAEDIRAVVAKAKDPGDDHHNHAMFHASMMDGGAEETYEDIIEGAIKAELADHGSPTRVRQYVQQQRRG